MTDIAGITVGSIFFIVIVVAITILGVLALLTPVFIYLISIRVKELLQEQRKANFNINEELQKIMSVWKNFKKHLS